MKIFSIYYMHKPGGFCKRLYQLLNTLAAEGHDVHYYSLDTTTTALASNVTQHRIFFPVQSRQGLFFWGLFTLWLPLYVFFVFFSLRPERQVAFGAYYATISLPARKLFRIPCILFLRSLVFKINRLVNKPLPIQFFSAWFDRIGILSSTTVICMTKSMQQELLQHLKKDLKNVKILSNSLPTVPSQFKLYDHKEPVLLSSGVLDSRKNISFLIEALNQFKKNNTTAQFSVQIAGDGPLRYSLEKMARNLGLSHIHFSGWVENLWQEFARVDLVIHPSWHEGVSNSILEALAAGLPVLASDIPEHREFLDAELLFPLNNAEVFIEKLNRFLSDPQYKQLLVNRSKESALKLKFDWPTAATKLAVGPVN